MSQTILRAGAPKRLVRTYVCQIGALPGLPGGLSTLSAIFLALFIAHKFLVVVSDPRRQSGDLRQAIQYLTSNLPPEISQQMIAISADSNEETQRYPNLSPSFAFLRRTSLAHHDVHTPPSYW
jgi:hypothetical protein